jgi:predicted TPR repeat methyltransferase
MALAHCTIGEIDKAIEIFEEWLAEEPGDPIATHMLAACSGREVPRRASDRFVASTFDRFAASFEEKLASLSYRAPALVAAMLQELSPEPRKDMDTLDAGCGTGLCGALIAPYARRLAGIDLSAGMLERAREKNVYDELVEGELTAHLRAARDAFDLIVSADALVYFGALEDVVAAAASALRPGGSFIFTLEDAATREAPLGYRLELHGRYSHARRYVERLLADAGSRPGSWKPSCGWSRVRPFPGSSFARRRRRSADLVRLDVVLESDAGIERAVGLLRLVFEVHLGETQRDAFRRGGRVAGARQRDARDDDVVHLDDQELLLAFAGLARRDRRFFDVLTGGARFQEIRRRLVDAMEERKVVEGRLARAATPARAGRAGLAHAPGPGEHLDLVFVLAVERLALDVAELCEDVRCHGVSFTSFLRTVDAALAARTLRSRGFRARAGSIDLAPSRHRTSS